MGQGIYTRDAQTRLQTHHSRVRRGGTPLTAHRATSCHMDSLTHADAAQIGPTQAVSAETGETAKMAGLSWHGWVRPKFKKKKKKVQNAPFELNLKP